MIPLTVIFCVITGIYVDMYDFKVLQHAIYQNNEILIE